MSNRLLETHIPANINVPIRLQEYGVTIFNSIKTKSALKKIIKKKLILVNGDIATTATLIKNKDRIELFEFPEKEANKRVDLDLTIVFEDDYLAIVYKPPGILVSGNKFKTIDNALSHNLQPSSQLDATRPRPVHRLDYPTSGLLLVGKTKDSIVQLNKMFEQKKISKVYYAVTIGKMNSSGTINVPVNEKVSNTYYELEVSLKSERFDSLNLVKLFPKTGRKHQLRVHMASLGNPILGDATYGIERLILKGKGLYLHAYSLKFIHPFTHEQMEVSKEPPGKFEKIFPESKLFSN